MFLKTKITCFLLLLCTLLLPVPVARTAYAATDEPSYDSFVDEVAGMEEPYWSFDFYPVYDDYNYIWNAIADKNGTYYGDRWDIATVSFYFDLHNEHPGEMLVGYNLSELEIVFDFTYKSQDEEYNSYSSTATFSYPLKDFLVGDDYIDVVLPYNEVLSGSLYHSSGYNTIIQSVDIYIRSTVMDTFGTITRYIFQHKDDYGRHVYTGISYYRIIGS